jgi:hypothetical protein
MISTSLHGCIRDAIINLSIATSGFPSPGYGRVAKPSALAPVKFL